MCICQQKRGAHHILIGVFIRAEKEHLWKGALTRYNNNNNNNIPCLYSAQYIDPRMKNGHLLQRKRGRGKGASAKLKGALIIGEKGKGHFYKWIGALVKVKGALFLCKKWALPTIFKGEFWGTWKQIGGGGGGGALCPLPPFESRLCVPLPSSNNAALISGCRPSQCMYGILISMVYVHNKYVCTKYAPHWWCNFRFYAISSYG